MKNGTLVAILIIALSVLICVGSCVTTYKTRIERNVLFQPAENGDYAEVKRLIEEGADVNAQDIDGYTALMTASANGHPEVTKLLIEGGANVNAQSNDGETALMLALMRGRNEITQLLMEAGAKEY